MLTARIRTLPEFQKHWENNKHIYHKIHELEAKICKKNRGTFTLKGFSYPAQSEVSFHVDYMHSDDITVNWRERVICPKTHLNNRLRATVHFLDLDLSPAAFSSIYIAEQSSQLYDYLDKKYANVTGSEYLGLACPPGATNERGWRNEDAVKLSFRDESFDFYLTFDCFQYIPDFLKAFSESYRILKEGGMLYWTVPFNANSYENALRATVNSDGAIGDNLPLQFGEDSNNIQKDALSHPYFGWEMFVQLKQIGFKDSYAITYWSDSLGYYGSNQFLFVAIK
jgi:SAM-dependent methyltransferase